jgi:hypothetical protein
MKVYGRMEIKLHIFLNWVLGVGRWSALRSGCFIPREISPGIHRIWGQVSPRAYVDAVENSTFVDWTPVVQLATSYFTDWKHIGFIHN